MYVSAERRTACTDPRWDFFLQDPPPLKKRRVGRYRYGDRWAGDRPRLRPEEETAPGPVSGGLGSGINEKGPLSVWAIYLNLEGNYPNRKGAVPLDRRVGSGLVGFISELGRRVFCPTDPAKPESGVTLLPYA